MYRERLWLRLLVVAVVAAAVAAPVAVIAGDRFTDVPDSNIFHADIAWLADANVTKGCNPPANDEFCPKDPVTREQMAAFMRRLAQNRVVDAVSLEGRNAGDFVLTAGGLEVVAAFTWDGTEANPAVGDLLSVSRLGVGEYLVAFTDPLPTGPWPMFLVSPFSPDGKTNACSWLGGGFLNTIKVVCTDLAGAPQDTAFTGILMRPASTN